MVITNKPINMDPYEATIHFLSPHFWVDDFPHIPLYVGYDLAFLPEGFFGVQNIHQHLGVSKKQGFHENHFFLGNQTIQITHLWRFWGISREWQCIVWVGNIIIFEKVSLGFTQKMFPQSI